MQKFHKVTACEENQFMIKKWYFYLSLVGIIAFLNLSFKNEKTNLNTKVQTVEKKTTITVFSTPKSTDLYVASTQNLFFGYKEAIAHKESNGDYEKVNSLGYMGKYQFGSRTLLAIGVKNKQQFLSNPELQEKAFIALLSKNKSLLKSVIEKHEGQVINEILITESGILAAAHLAGAGSVKKFFRHNGKKRFRDAFGTSLQSYLKEFGGYDTSLIVADNDATVHSI